MSIELSRSNRTFAVHRQLHILQHSAELIAHHTLEILCLSRTSFCKRLSQMLVEICEKAPDMITCRLSPHVTAHAPVPRRFCVPALGVRQKTPQHIPGDTCQCLPGRCAHTVPKQLPLSRSLVNDTVLSMSKRCGPVQTSSKFDYEKPRHLALVHLPEQAKQGGILLRQGLLVQLLTPFLPLTSQCWSLLKHCQTSAAAAVAIPDWTACSC